MNANEFIDGYGKALDGDGEIDLVETYAILRQQQAEIEALKNQLLIKNTPKQEAQEK